MIGDDFLMQPTTFKGLDKSFKATGRSPAADVAERGADAARGGGQCAVAR